MVYDSECARVNSDASVTDPLPDSNTTVVRMIRRLIAEMPSYHIRVHWVKVRGHSNEHGNDAADKAATWGQNGGRQRIHQCHQPGRAQCGAGAALFDGRAGAPQRVCISVG